MVAAKTSCALCLLLLVVESATVYAQSEADAIGSAAAPATSVTSVPRAAPKYEDASIGFAFEYKVDNAAVCVAWPERLQDAGCDGLDYHNLVAYASAFNAAKGPVIRSMAYLRFDNNHTATISIAHVPTNQTVISQAIIDDLLDGVLEDIKKNVPATLTMSGSESGSRYDETEINGVDALRFEVTGDVPRGGRGYERSRAVGYILLGEHGLVMMTAITDPQHLRQTRAAAESIVKTMRLPPLAQKGIVKTSLLDHLLDSEIGLWLPLLVAAALLGVRSHFVGRKRKRRAQKA